MRNVGQAIGVAALGSVLLFGITSNINKAVLSDANVSESVATAISKKSITLMSDASFEQTISDIPMTDAEKEELVTINAKARVDATKTAFVVSVVVVLLALITTRWIKVQNKEEKERYLAERAASAPSTENAA
jgi:hypothetical protein